MSTPAKTVAVTCLVAAAFLAGYAIRPRPANPTNSTPVHRALYYTCPMHPEYRSDKPGEAPCCGMRLEPIFAVDGVNPAHASGAVYVSAAKQQMIGVRVAEVSRAKAVNSLRMVGQVAADEFRLYRVVGLSDGWVRELSEATVGALVKKDQILASFYAPESLGAQQAYLYATSTLDRFQAAGNETDSQIRLTKANIQQAYDSLRALGMSEAQILELGRTKDSTQNVRLISPVAGVIISRTIYPNQRFDRNTELYRIADLSRVWVMTDVFERDRELAKPGNRALVRYKGENFPAKMSDALPQFDPQSRTLKARFELENPGFVLRPGMFVDVEVQVDLPAALTVPEGAVIDSGRRTTVFVARGDGLFEPRTVETGRRLGDQVQIRKGLEAGERIVTSGNFLIDSESRMKLTAARDDAAPKDPVCRMDLDPKKPAAIQVRHAGKTYTFCSEQCKQKFRENPEKYLSTERGSNQGLPAGDNSQRGPA